MRRFIDTSICNCVNRSKRTANIHLNFTIIRPLLLVKPPVGRFKRFSVVVRYGRLVEPLGYNRGREESDRDFSLHFRLCRRSPDTLAPPFHRLLLPQTSGKLFSAVSSPKQNRQGRDSSFSCVQAAVNSPKNPKAISRHYLTMVDCKLTTHSFGSRKVRNMSREKELNWPGLLFTFAMMSILFWIGLISLLW